MENVQELTEALKVLIDRAGAISAAQKECWGKAYEMVNRQELPPGVSSSTTGRLPHDEFMMLKRLCYEYLSHQEKDEQDQLSSEAQAARADADIFTTEVQKQLPLCTHNVSRLMILLLSAMHSVHPGAFQH